MNGLSIQNPSFKEFQDMYGKYSGCRIMESANLRQEHQEEDLPFLFGGDIVVGGWRCTARAVG